MEEEAISGSESTSAAATTETQSIAPASDQSARPSTSLSSALAADIQQPEQTAPVETAPAAETKPAAETTQTPATTETTTPPAASVAAAPPTDEWAGIIDGVRKQAEAAGFSDPKSFIQAVTARNEHVATESARITEALQARVLKGEISAEVAAELFDSQIADSLNNFDRTTNAQREEARIHEQQAELFVKQIAQDFAVAQQTNPLLGGADGFASHVVTALATLGGASHTDAIQKFTAFTEAVGAQAVAAYVAKQSENSTNTAPVIPAGGGQGGSTEQKKQGLGAALRSLVTG